ncbi:serine/threonine protein kinase, partial [Streptomyces sp. NPDC058757]
ERDAPGREPERAAARGRGAGPSSRPSAPARTGGSRNPQSRPGTRPGARSTSTGRRPANPRLLRQRLVVFVVVTLLVALGIAAAQALQG